MNYEAAGPLTMLPLIVLTLAVANCIHILVSIQTVMRKGMEKMDAIVESVRINLLPRIHHQPHNELLDFSA